MGKYTIEFDDIMSSKLTKQTSVVTAKATTDNVVEFVDTFNTLSAKMGNRDGYTKVVQLTITNGEIDGASLRYVAKNKH